MYLIFLEMNNFIQRIIGFNVYHVITTLVIVISINHKLNPLINCNLCIFSYILSPYFFTCSNCLNGSFCYKDDIVCVCFTIHQSIYNGELNRFASIFLDNWIQIKIPYLFIIYFC